MNKIIFLDGAMGSSLAAKGKDPTASSNTKNPQLVKEILKDYIESGADIIETNTFSATAQKFKDFEKINRLGVQIAKDAVKESGKNNIRIAGAIGPTGKMVKPIGSLGFEEAVHLFKSQIKIIVSEGVDLLIIETMDDISELKAALIAAREEAPGLEVLSTMTFSEENYTSTGTPPEVAARVMDSLGSAGVGVNCSFGPEKLAEVVEKMRRVTKKPIIVQANAGLPKVENGETVYPIGPEEYAQHAKKLVEAGASYIGGCCGTTPAHIRTLIKKLKDLTPKRPPDKIPLIITSRTGWAEFGNFPLIIGERINFTAYRELRESDSKVIQEGMKQKNAGADALDVNLGRDEMRMWEVIEALIRRVDLPIVLDSQNPQVVEKVIRRYPGILLLNSISGEKHKLKQLLPIVKKYGVPFIALCVDDNGVPKTIKGKMNVCKNILNKARIEKIDLNNVVVDPLAMALSADIYSAKKTLKAISKIRNKTILGISNVSSGLPQRALLNQVFSALAIQSGCSALIVNPLDTDLIYSVYSAALLSGRDKNAGRYLRYFSPQEKVFSFEHPLLQAVFEGDGENAIKQTKKILKDNASVNIINEYIIPALDKVGECYNARKIFLPQLIESAQAAQKAIKLVQCNLYVKKSETKKRSKILIATVKGDIHDIGKNLVALMLQNHSCDVKDLGVDIESEKIIEEASNWGADIIALSSLMTTTMESMADITDILKKEKKSTPVIIGGAAITKKYATSIGAYYGKDAVEAVRVVIELVKK